MLVPLAVPHLTTRSLMRNFWQNWRKLRKLVTTYNQILTKLLQGIKKWCCCAWTISTLAQRTKAQRVKVNYYQDHSLKVWNSHDKEWPLDIKDFKEDLKVRLEKEFLRVFPNSELPQFLERVLVEPRLKLLNALVADTEGTNINQFVSALICLFETRRKMSRYDYTFKELTALGFCIGV